jgi:hypothetical protein
VDSLDWRLETRYLDFRVLLCYKNIPNYTFLFHIDLDGMVECLRACLVGLASISIELLFGPKTQSWCENST